MARGWREKECEGRFHGRVVFFHALVQLTCRSCAAKDGGAVDRAELARQAERLRDLHRRDVPLILPNAWDAASARGVVEAGFLAVATTSGGVAASLGWPDGEKAPIEEMFAALARIARVVDVPVTADVETGHGLESDELVDYLFAAGAVGCNIEDTERPKGRTLVPVEVHAERIASIKEAGRSAGVDVVVNARVDVFARRVGEPEQRVELALDRARHYADAGADCVYPILADEASLTAFVAGYSGAVNAAPAPGVARFTRLLEVGVARISFGSALQRCAMDDLGRRLKAIAARDEHWAS
jgi:2-methylisocitrate lyase-like PEP mutase family enzyme